eukprot:4387405-Pyramimonas_sp.AAC.1
MRFWRWVPLRVGLLGRHSTGPTPTLAGLLPPRLLAGGKEPGATSPCGVAVAGPKLRHGASGANYWGLAIMEGRRTDSACVCFVSHTCARAQRETFWQR